MRTLIVTLLVVVACKKAGDAELDHRDPSSAPSPATPQPSAPKPAAPSVPRPCGADPCPCAAGSEVKANNIIVECDLKETFGVSGLICGAGKAKFNADDGELASCVTDSMWALPYETPMDKDHVVMCGPGPITRRKTGGLASCTLADDVLVGQTKVVKLSTVTIDAKLAVTSATDPGGAKQCFDPAGKIDKCP